MSWLDSLNTIKGQLTSLAQEVLAEGTGGGGVEEREPPTDTADTTKEESSVDQDKITEDLKQKNEELNSLCSTKDNEIAALRKQLADLQTKTNSENAGQPKTSLEKHGSLEDSWFWDPDNIPSDSSAKNDHEANSETSSGGEMITIPLEQDVATNESGSYEKIARGPKPDQEDQQRLKKLLQENSFLNGKVISLTAENQELNKNLEELDNQNSIAMQNLLELRDELQKKYKEICEEHKNLKQEYTDKVQENDEQVNNLKKELEEAKAARIVHQETIQKCKIQLKSYKEKLSKLEEENGNFKEKLILKDAHILEIVEKVEKIEKELPLKDELITNLEKDKKLLENEIILLKEEKCKVQNQLEEFHLSNKTELDSKFVLVQDEFNSTDDEDWAKKYKSLAEEHDVLQKKQNELEMKIRTLEETNKVNLEEKELNIQEMVKSLEEMKIKFDNSEKNYNLLFESNQKLVKELELTKHSLMAGEKEYKQRIDYLEKENDSLRKGSTDDDQEKWDIQQKLYSLEFKVPILEDENEDLRKRIEALKESTPIDPEEYESLKEKYSVLSEGFQAAGDEFKDFQEEQTEIRSKHEAQIKELLRKNSSLEQQVAALQTESENYRKAIKEMKMLKSDENLLQNFSQDETKCKGENRTEKLGHLEKENLRLQEQVRIFEEKLSLKHESNKEGGSIESDSISYKNLKNLFNILLEIDLPDEGSDKLNNIENSLETIREKMRRTNSLEKQLEIRDEHMAKILRENSALREDQKNLESTLNRCRTQYQNEIEELMESNEILLNELENYKSNKLETIHENNEETVALLERQLEDCSNLNRSLETEYKDVNRHLEDLEKEKRDLQEKLDNLQETNSKLIVEMKDLQLQVETLESEKCNLIFEINEMKTDDKKSALDSQVSEYKTKIWNLESQLESLSKDHADLVAAMQAQQANFTDHKKQAEAIRKEFEDRLREKEALIICRQSENDSLKSEIEKYVILGKDYGNLLEKFENLQRLQSEYEEKHNKICVENEKLNVTVKSLEDEKTKLERNLSDLKDSLKLRESHLMKKDQLTQSSEVEDKIEPISSQTQSNKEQNTIYELSKTIESLNQEKQELIRTVTAKHNENMQYYMEIQRLGQLVQVQMQTINSANLASGKSEMSTKNRDEENHGVKVAGVLSNNQTEGHSVDKECENCVQLQAEAKRNAIEMEKFKDQINFLKEKSDILTTNLLTEQSNQKLLQQEKSELAEQNNSLRKDLDRLRQHLVELEENHTQETLEMQNAIEQTKAKMIELQEDVAKSSNAYTSASIRANQHAETLQVQYQLLCQQRDELMAKLSSAEDKESRNQAALVNLQCALEQFQKEKDNEIRTATYRIQKELQNELEKQKQLQQEISSLSKQLSDAKQGLLAAARLSDKLEKSQSIISSLEEEIEKLKSKNKSLDEKLQNTELSQADKIEKNLVKSLIIGYLVSTNQNDKLQILKLISSVLDFNQTESDKVGLNKNQSGGWLGGFLHAGAEGQLSLTGAFVKFLEKESQQPGANAPNLLNIISERPGATGSIRESFMDKSRERKLSSDSTKSERKISVGGTTMKDAVQPILLNESVMEQFAPTRNSSSILKDILNDS